MFLNYLVGFMLLCLSLDVATAQEEKTEPALQTDFAICQKCRSDDPENSEVRSFLDMIAATRWSMNGSSAGLVKIQDQTGRITIWRYESEEGKVSGTELIESTPPAAADVP